MIDVNTPANDREKMWQEWAALAREGDKRAYNLLLRDIVPYIRNLISPGLANHDWVDDIAQEVLISVHKSLHTYSPDRPFKPWLTAIIRFRRTDFLRAHYRARRQTQAAMEDGDIFGENVTFPARAGELKDVEKALESIPEKQRRVFILMKIKGHSAQEVADEMSMTVSAVKVSVHRTANKLREILEENG